MASRIESGGSCYEGSDYNAESETNDTNVPAVVPDSEYAQGFGNFCNEINAMQHSISKLSEAM